MKVTFFGATGTVTGSCFLVEEANLRLLVDCGMFQGTREMRDCNRLPFPFEPGSIDAVVLTHAHIDHSGLIPKLCKHGFKGKVYATRATADLAGIMLPDSGHIQEIEAEWQNRKRRRAGAPPLEPLYTADDAYASLKHFEGVDYEQEVALQGLTLRYHDAGHILGSSFVDLTSTAGGPFTIRFSGDIGQTGTPVIRDPASGGRPDFLVMESTYGGRKHEDRTERVGILKQVIEETVRRGGNVIIPSFAVGRTQELLFHIKQLLAAHEIAPISVFIDSPMAVSATEVFKRNPQCFDDEILDLMKRSGSPFEFPGLHMIRAAEESKALNDRTAPAVIISANGMCEAGRILHHLKHNLWRPESAVLFVGYQAEGTLGRRILSGEKTVHVLGDPISVRAHIHSIEGFSAHADEDGLINWVRTFDRSPARVFLVHGESAALSAMAARVKGDLGLEATVPERGETFDVSAAGAQLLGRVETASGAPGDFCERIDRAWSAIRATLAESSSQLPAYSLKGLAEEMEALAAWHTRTAESGSVKAG